jgi:hypothetical protein
MSGIFVIGLCDPEGKALRNTVTGSNCSPSTELIDDGTNGI